MTENEKLEFRAEVSKNASEIVTKLMVSDLGPLDAAFCLGSALKLISGVMAKLNNEHLEDTGKIVLDAFNHGFTNT